MYKPKLFSTPEVSGKWERHPQEGWHFGWDTSHWAIAGKANESRVGYSYEFFIDNDTDPFRPRIHAQKVRNHINEEFLDTLTLTNFPFDLIMETLHANKLITDATFNNYKSLKYYDFVNSVKDEKYVSFAGVTDDGAWLRLEHDRITVLKALEKAKIIPAGIAQEYKKFFEEIEPHFTPQFTPM